jgi:hypothetical protein
MDEILSGVRETLRTAIIAAIPIAIVQLQSPQADWGVLWLAVVIGLLRGMEKWAHSKDVKTGLSFDMIK